MATEGFSIERATLIVAFPRNCGEQPQGLRREPDRLPFHVIAVEKLSIGRLRKCHSNLAPYHCFRTEFRHPSFFPAGVARIETR